MVEAEMLPEPHTLCLHCQHIVRIGSAWWFCMLKEASVYARSMTCGMVKDMHGEEEPSKMLAQKYLSGKRG